MLFDARQLKQSIYMTFIVKKGFVTNDSLCNLTPPWAGVPYKMVVACTPGKINHTPESEQIYIFLPITAHATSFPIDYALLGC